MEEREDKRRKTGRWRKRRRREIGKAMKVRRKEMSTRTWKRGRRRGLLRKGRSVFAKLV